MAERNFVPDRWKTFKEEKLATVLATMLLSRVKKRKRIGFPPKVVSYYTITLPEEELDKVRITVDEKDLETMRLIKELFGEEVIARIESAPIVIRTIQPSEDEFSGTAEHGKEMPKVKEIKPLGVSGGELATGAGAGGGHLTGQLALVPTEIKTEKIEIISEGSEELTSVDNKEEYYEDLEKKIEEILKFTAFRPFTKVQEEIKEGKVHYDIYEFPNVFKKKLPTAHVRLFFSEEIGEFWYVIYDYMWLNDEERMWFELIRDTMNSTPNYVSKVVELLELEPIERDKAIIEVTLNWFNELWDLFKVPYPKWSQQYVKILTNILREFVGFKILNYLFADKKNIEDVTYEAVNQPVFIRYKPAQTWAKVLLYDFKTGMFRPMTFTSVEEANEFVRLLAQKAEQYVNVARPVANGRLPDGSRLHAKYGTVYTDPRKGPNFTIRFKSESIVLPLDLINWRTIPPLAMAYGWVTIENVDTASTLVVGGTGVGKTTTLQSLLLFVPQDKKILTIEDTPELELPHENWEANYYDEQRPEDMEILLKSALRARPDYIVIQEVRGREAEIMFQAMASGHAGLSTFHADSFEKLIHRLTTKPISLPEGLLGTLKQVWIQKWVTSGNTSVRRVAEILEVATDERGNVVGIPLFKLDINTMTLMPTEAFYERVYSPDSIMFKAMIFEGFKKPEKFFIEVENRGHFLRSLADLYNVYKNRQKLLSMRLEPYQRDAITEIVNFWEFYKEKVRQKMRKSFRRGEPNMYHIFFQMLFEYKYNPEFFPKVLKLASENIPPLLEVLE